MPRVPLLCVVLVIACGPSTPSPDPAPPCVPDDALLDRGYDDVTYLTTHNAMSNADDGWSLPNQRWGLERQLNDGVRGFMLDVYEEGGRAFLFHASAPTEMHTLALHVSLPLAF